MGGIIIKERLIYIDNIRSLIIILVVIAHSCITYSGIGGWYYMENTYEQISPTEFIVFGLFISIMASFAMGLMFLIAGYFVPANFDKQGGLSFLIGRFIRLGLPAAFYIFIINPINFYILLPNELDKQNTLLANFRNYVLNMAFIYDSGPLWFAIVLLIFSLLYALFKLIPFKIKLNFLEKFSPNLIIILLIIFVTFITFNIRLVYPIGTEFYNYQPAFYTQYIVLFIIGIILYRLKLLDKLNYKLGIAWLIIGLPISLLLFALSIYLGDGLNNPLLILGGFNIQAFLYVLFESTICASICLGLLTTFKKYFNKPNKINLFLNKNAFSVYILHTPLLILVSLLFKKLNLNLFIKALIVALLALVLSFTISYLIKKCFNLLKTKAFI